MIDQIYGRNQIPIITRESREVFRYFFRLLRMILLETMVRLTELYWSKKYDIKNNHERAAPDYQLKKLASYYRQMISLSVDELGNKRARLNQETTPEFEVKVHELSHTGFFGNFHGNNNRFLRSLHKLLSCIEKGIALDVATTENRFVPIWTSVAGFSEEEINTFCRYSEEWVYERLVPWLNELATTKNPKKCTLYKLQKFSTFFT